MLLNPPIKYLIIKSNQVLDYEFIVCFFKDLLGQRIIAEHNDGKFRIIHDYTDELNIEEAINSLNNDLVLNLKVFSSKLFKNYEDMETNYKIINKYFEALDSEKSFFEEKGLIKETILTEEDNNLKLLALGPYLHDLQMMDIIKQFFKHNLNTSASATALYMHRNTLINKLDRFYAKTDFDLRHFEDAVVIYEILKN